jgi:hypothetical protein
MIPIRLPTKQALFLNFQIAKQIAANPTIYVFFDWQGKIAESTRRIERKSWGVLDHRWPVPQYSIQIALVHIQKNDEACFHVYCRIGTENCLPNNVSTNCLSWQLRYAK